MYCPKCGAQCNNGICPNGCNYPNNMIPIPQPKQKKLKLWHIILIIVAVFLAAGVIADIYGATDNSLSNSSSAPVSSQVTSSTEKATKNSSKKAASKTDYKKELAAYKPIDFATLARNPDSYKGKKFVMTGEVIQVLEPTFDEAVQLRINVTKQTYEYIDDVTWTDTIFATVKIPKDTDRILEGDILTFYGTCEGLYTYDSVLGQSISLPKINIKYYGLNEAKKIRN